MGGGGAMRAAAAKIAGIGVSSGGGLRGAGFTVIPPSSEPSMVKSVSRSASSSVVSVSRAKVDDLSGARSSVRELDDWEFAGVEEDPVAIGSVDGETSARVVFSGPPTVEEAKEATRELKDAIEMFSRSHASDGGHLSSLSLSVDTDSSETKTCIASDPGASPVSRAAMQAFAFLSESPKAQPVVASVASDPNVWNAVMQNETLMEFLKTNKKSSVTLEDAESLNSDAHSPDESNPITDSTDAGVILEDSGSLNSDAHSPDENCSKPGIPLMGFVQDIKLKVIQIISNASAFLHDLFGPTSANKANCNDEDDYGKARPLFNNDARTFLALAVMVIVVVILKRT